MIAGLERGKSVRGSRDEYQLLRRVSAVSLASASEEPGEAIARVGERGAEVLEKKGRLILYRTAKATQASVGRVGTTTVYPTVVNAKTGNLGVLTGALIVKPKNMADVESIASGHALEVGRAYASLRTVFYRVGPGVDIVEASAALQADSRVETAYPEIVEHVRVPQ